MMSDGWMRGRGETREDDLCQEATRIARAAEYCPCPPHCETHLANTSVCDRDLVSIAQAGKNVYMEVKSLSH